jgi:hypothetical protein|tara:strand:+ start:1712 stop:1999 length:288 start_codon:yes stop_codon:yes gene_type:complete
MFLVGPLGEQRRDAGVEAARIQQKGGFFRRVLGMRFWPFSMATATAATAVALGSGGKLASIPVRPFTEIASCAPTTIGELCGPNGAVIFAVRRPG